MQSTKPKKSKLYAIPVSFQCIQHAHFLSLVGISCKNIPGKVDKLTRSI